MAGPWAAVLTERGAREPRARVRPVPRRLTSSEPDLDTVADNPWRGARALQPDDEASMPDTSGAVPSPIGPGPNTR